MSHQDELKSASLGHGETNWCGINVAIVVEGNHSLFILFLPREELVSILDNILSFMAINVHTILLLAIPPVKLLQPSLRHLQ